MASHSANHTVRGSTPASRAWAAVMSSGASTRSATSVSARARPNSSWASARNSLILTSEVYHDGWMSDPSTMMTHVPRPLSADRVMQRFSPATRDWFTGAFSAPDARAGGRLGRGEQRRGRPRRRADRLGQDPRGVPVVPGPAGRRAGPRGAAAALPGAVRLAAQGPGGRRRAQPPLPADRDPGQRPAPRRPRAGHHGRGPLRRHARGRAARPRPAPAGRPHHHAGVAVPARHLPRPGVAGRGARR